MNTASKTYTVLGGAIKWRGVEGVNSGKAAGGDDFAQSWVITLTPVVPEEFEAVNDCQEIDIHDSEVRLLNILCHVRSLVEPLFSNDAGVGHQCVDSAMPLEGLLEHSRMRVPIDKITLDEDTLVSQHLLRFRTSLGIDIRKDDLIAFANQRPAHVDANTSGSASHDGDFRNSRHSSILVL